MKQEEKSVAVVIPMYRSELSETEKISFAQCRKILGMHPIIIIAPQDLMLNPCDVSHYRIERFCRKFFKDVEGYNKLLLSQEFYRRFAEFEYILIYQLDAYVFYDKLHFFCSLQYDYIGAPWLEGAAIFDSAYDDVAFVGNGGFSLRRTKAFLRCLEMLCLTPEELELNEDFIFSYFAKAYLNIAPVRVALSFAFETKVRECFRLNQDRLPFGCHAWAKYDFVFWKPFLEKDGYETAVIELVETAGIPERKCSKYLAAAPQQIKESLKQFLPDCERGVYLWGTGLYGMLCGKLLEKAGIQIMGYIDNDQSKEGTCIREIPVLPSWKLPEKSMNYPFVITMIKRYGEAEEFLQQRGLTKGKDYIVFHAFMEDLNNRVNILELD